jgi:hypothetical protein
MDSNTTKPLHVSERDCLVLYRALLDYDKILKYSAISDSTLVAAELHQVRALQDRINLMVFSPSFNEGEAQ